VGGIIAQELRAFLYHQEERLPIFGFVSGLGGRDITPDLIEEAVQHALDHSRPEGDVLWLGLKR
jgi:pyruvate/2-oxoacid:ferredoxin oxidoreductase alpha subunit